MVLVMSPTPDALHRRSRARDFCLAFAASTGPRELLDAFFVRAEPRITEHGPAWARARLPFLGHTFTGRETTTTTTNNGGEAERDTCDRYFALLAETLSVGPEGLLVPSLEHFTYAPGHGDGVVSVVLQGTFVSVQTGKSWQEDFVHRFAFSSTEGRIEHWEIWADPLSAWFAVQDDSEGEGAT
ncbi:MAG: hypothetical protein M1833_002467 [Piccolia ochrophora]|nr:MAG: hypothetical protein M1833_002467 [Piccolia ochrophora]